MPNLPALRQSMVETAACPRAYVEIHINGKAQPDSIPSERGTEIHHVMSEYVKHCAAKRIAADWEYFDSLTTAAGPVAGPILDGIRDTYEVDWQHVYSTEIPLALDEAFNPSYQIVDATTGEITELPRIPGVAYLEGYAAHTGTLDVILLSDDGRRAKVPDYKSHPSPFEANTYQSTLYPFMLFKHLPQLEVITFELNFVRYRNCYRSVTWKREGMPAMQAEISRARQRQRITHERPDEALALPCTTCTYCPLAKDFSCPIGQWNEYTTLSLADRLMWKIWMGKMNAQNNPILRANAEVNGPVRYQDGNGRVYEFGEMPVPSTRYPLDRTTIEVLDTYSSATGDEWVKWGLNVSATKLKSRLDTKKRAALREAFEDSIIETGTKPKYAVRTPQGIEDDSEKYREE